jgi:hypothetical protein
MSINKPIAVARRIKSYAFCLLVLFVLLCFGFVFAGLCFLFCWLAGVLAREVWGCVFCFVGWLGFWQERFGVMFFVLLGFFVGLSFK